MTVLSHLALATFALAFGLNSARAEPPTLVPAATAVTAPAVAQKCPSPPAGGSAEYRSVTCGIAIGGGFAVGKFGLAIPAQAVYQTTGLQSYDGRKFLLQWDASAGAVGGYAGNEHPGFFFVGGKLNLSSELGYRTMPTSNWSPYLGSGLNLNGVATAVVGQPLGTLNQHNNLDGLAGVYGVAATRFSFGGSYLDPKHSLLLTAFVQEALRAPGSVASGNAYTEVGVHAQLDVTKNLNIMLEALYGKTGQMTDPAFGATNQGSHFEAVASVRKMFGKWWVSLDGKISEDGNKTTYDASPLVFTTATPLVPSISLSVGVPIQ